MGKIEAFALAGFDLWFYSLEPLHEPPHFHVRKPGAWEIRVYFLLSHAGHLEYNLKWSDRPQGPSRKELKAILEETLAHREALLQEWETKVVRS